MIIFDCTDYVVKMTVHANYIVFKMTFVIIALSGKNFLLNKILILCTEGRK